MSDWSSDVCSSDLDIYDERDQFWRTAESHSITFPNEPVVVNGVQVHYDLQSRRYVIINLTNEERKLIEYDWTAKTSYFQPQSLKRFADSGHHWANVERQSGVWGKSV